MANKPHTPHKPAASGTGKPPPPPVPPTKTPGAVVLKQPKGTGPTGTQ